MNQSSQHIPLKLNLDKSRKRLDPDECFFLLNHERNLAKEGSKKGSLGQATPKPANYKACEVELPTGENFAVKSYYSKLTNELYSWIYNSNGVHFIQRINGAGECEIVYHGECLELSAEPEHEITQFRAYLQVDKLCANRHGKALIWTNGKHPIGMIDTEASIATNFFTTDFFQRCGDPCDMIRMCVPDPCGCLVGEFVPLEEGDKGKKNNILDVGIMLSYMHEYYDGRRSIWADPSTLFFQDTKGCFDNPEGFPRCIRTRIPIGGPMVDKIHIGYWKEGVWYLADTIDKYKKYNSTQQYWYERDLAELTGYSDTDCSFDYFFCNDKQCDTIDPNYFNRVFNPMPIKPQAILPIGIGEDKTALAFLNYEQGYCPIDKSEMEKIQIGTTCAETNCKPEYATVKVYAVVHNRLHDRNQFVYRMNGDAANSPDDTSDPAYFGGLNDALSGGIEVGYDQLFRDKTRNFIAYVEGLESWGTMEQYKSHAFFNNTEKWGTVGNMDDVQTRNRWRRAFRNGEYFYQYLELKVIKGVRGFIRLASHKATGNEPDTSTFVIGTQNLFTYKGNSDLTDQFNEGVEEVYFDTCNGDVDLSDQAFVIDDNAADSGSSNKASAYHGYLKDHAGRRVEGAIIEMEGFQYKTDHNGFFHFYLEPGDDDAHDALVKVEQDCHSFSTIKTESINGEKGANTRHDITIENEAYDNTFYAKVNALVKDCNGDVVPGVRVALSGSKYVVTDIDGYARFRIRNYITRDRDVRAVVMNNKGCFDVTCDGACNPCMPTSASGTANCYSGIPTITFPEFVVNIFSESLKKGLKAGGRYPFGAFVRLGCGQISAVYENIYLDIPKTQEKGAEGFCTHFYKANGLKLPEDATCLSIVRGENVNPFELQWVIDKIERVDGKIKLTIQSLNDYNEKYFFKTNTIYQWLKGDRIEFIKNGDGKILTIVDHGLLNYLTLSPFHDEVISGQEDAPADFFNQLLIDDDGKLDMITKGAIIEIQRSKECTTKPVYHSICVNIPVVNGELVYPEGVFTTFDTYFVSRTIGTNPIQQFEHHSPSDFWGEKLSDIGREYFVNKYENKRRFGRNATINAPHEFNYFGDLVKTIDPDGHGDIIAACLIDNKIGHCISEHDNSLFEVGNDLLKVGGDGVVRAVSPDQLISDSQPKISGSYGCQYPHIGSILFGDGYASWVDVNKHSHVFHNFQTAVAADEGKVKTYFSRRCQEIETKNRSVSDPLEKLRFATGQNQITSAIHITIKALKDGGIYNEIKPFLKQNDTISFDPLSGDYLEFNGFTPEAYGQLNLFDGAGCAFVSFLNSTPYIHPIIPEKWNEFYGQAVDWIVGVSMNKFPDKIKKGLAIEIQSETRWFVADVSTETPNFRSEIPAIRWQKDRNKWNAAFLRDINSRGGLYKGKEPSGYYHDVTFIRDNTDALQYGTIDDSKRVAFSVLDIIFFKFIIQEQSGFNQNL